MHCYTEHTYRYVFHISVVIAALALISNFVLYRRFKALGGPENYVAPI